MMCDYRCPKCNGILRGREDVSIVKQKPKLVPICKHCGLILKLVSSTDDLGLVYSFEPLVPIVWKPLD